MVSLFPFVINQMNWFECQLNPMKKLYQIYTKFVIYTKSKIYITSTLKIYKIFKIWYKYILGSWEHWSISGFKLHFLLFRVLNILPQVLCSQPLLKDIWVCSFCKLHSFTVFYTVIYSQCYKIYFLYFINWLNAGALLQLADAGGIVHMTRTVSFPWISGSSLPYNSQKPFRTQTVNLCLLFKTY